VVPPLPSLLLLLLLLLLQQQPSTAIPLPPGLQQCEHH
jgi:hypothetical protein